MSKINFHKVVAALPSVLEANSVYYVRVGTGFDQYITNSTGTIAAYSPNVKLPTASEVTISDAEGYFTGNNVEEALQQLAEDMSPAEIKSAYESNTNTNAFTDAEKSKLAGIASGATANATNAQLRDRSTHTGTQAISTVSGLQTALDGKVNDDDARLTDAREWTASTVTQAEAETGTASTARKWTAQRVRQAILGWWNTSTEKTKLDGIATGATKNATDAQLRDRSTHTGTQDISTISGLDIELASKVDKVSGKQLSTEDYTSAEKTKLSGIATGATKNATDAQLRDRATHTGVQPIDSVEGLQDALDDKVDNTDPRMTNAREWTASVVTQAEAEAGTSTTARKWTAQRVRQAILGWWDASTFKIKLDGIESGATKNATDAQLRDRATHTGVQPISSISGLQEGLDNKADISYVNTQLDDKVDKTISVVAGPGLSGGGTLASDSTLSVNFGTTAGTVKEGNWLPSVATKAQVLSGSASGYVTGSSYVNTIAWNTSSHSSGTVTLDLDTSLNHILNITGSVTIGAPSNTTLGKTGDIVLRVNANVVVGWNTQWKFLGSVPNIGANGEVWVVSYKVLSATEILASASKVV